MISIMSLSKETNFYKHYYSSSIEKIGYGSIPAVVTVPHDGNLKEIGNVIFSFNPCSKKRDIAVRDIACDMVNYMEDAYKQSPCVLIQKIHRQYLPHELFNFYRNQVKDILKSYNHTILLLDLHGFTIQPPIAQKLGKFDLIAGTSYRKTIKNTNIDVFCADFFRKRGYSFYLPNDTPLENELYQAASDKALINFAKDAYLPNVVGLQLEIDRRFREKNLESIILGKKLSHDLGDFLFAVSEILIQNKL